MDFHSHRGDVARSLRREGGWTILVLKMGMERASLSPRTLFLACWGHSLASPGIPTGTGHPGIVGPWAILPMEVWGLSWQRERRVNFLFFFLPREESFVLLAAGWMRAVG